MKAPILLPLFLLGVVGGCRNPQTTTPPRPTAQAPTPVRVAEPVRPRPPNSPRLTAAALAPTPTPQQQPPAAAEDQGSGMQSSNPQERLRAVRNESAYSDSLATMVNDADEEVRRAALNMLGRARDPRAIPALTGALVQSNPDRIVAAEGLVMIGTADALHTVRTYAASAPEADQHAINDVLRQFQR